MTDIKAILAKYGISVPEEHAAEFDKVFKENYKTVAEVAKIEAARDNYKSQLTTAQDTLKTFEGVDVNELQGKISQLTADLASKDSQYAEKIADMEFSALLDGQISAAKAKNVKAVKALLDVDALKQSKNRDADIQSALESVKADNGYLFEEYERGERVIPILLRTKKLLCFSTFLFFSRFVILCCAMTVAAVS